MPRGFHYPHSNSPYAIAILALALVLILATDSMLKQKKFIMSLIVPCVCLVTVMVPLLLGKSLIPEAGVLLIVVGNYIWKFRDEKEKGKEKAEEEKSLR